MGEIAILLHSFKSFFFFYFEKSLPPKPENVPRDSRWLFELFFFLSSLISDVEMITHQETKTKDEKDYIMILLF